MPPKPTCKVVKREGQRGARIDPKGCKVRTTKDAQGNKKKETKQGNEKIKRTTTKREGDRDDGAAARGLTQTQMDANARGGGAGPTRSVTSRTGSRVLG